MLRLGLAKRLILLPISRRSLGRYTELVGGMHRRRPCPSVARASHGRIERREDASRIVAMDPDVAVDDVRPGNWGVRDARVVTGSSPLNVG